ncbi:uncharacterized protein LOC133833149 [Humulus lupulus]|uniref:uncharacterized protein LOC133833149 n=1 Tax=Humulus lupulus TaxID=3486 RepID=UPI002B40BEF4|nr:uncharacterized protein LOC133833149 [Humulus lupulus]
MWRGDYQVATKVPRPKIQKVPQVLRDEQKNFEKYYYPKWISIGPIHHGNPKFQLAEQRFKFLFAAEFVKNSGHQSQEHLYKKVMENIKVLKLCFDDEVLKEYYRKDGKDDEALGWMLFLDGCFTLQFIYSIMKDESMTHFEIKNDQVAFVLHDFFLLENQIPYLVLSLLMENSEKEFSENLEGSIKQFLSLSVLTPEKYGKPTMVPPKDYMPVHLLDFLRLALLQTSHHDRNKRSKSCIYTYLRNKLTSPRSLDNNNPKTSTSKISIIFKSFKKNPAEEKQQTFRKRSVTDLKTAGINSKQSKSSSSKDINSKQSKRSSSKDIKKQTFRSVMDLKAAGINLKRSKSSSLKDIKSSSSLFSAELELPPITVDDSMAPKFLNLIAFEIGVIGYVNCRLVITVNERRMGLRNLKILEKDMRQSPRNMQKPVVDRLVIGHDAQSESENPRSDQGENAKSQLKQKTELDVKCITISEWLVRQLTEMILYLKFGAYNTLMVLQHAYQCVECLEDSATVGIDWLSTECREDFELKAFEDRFGQTESEAGDPLTFLQLKKIKNSSATGMDRRNEWRWKKECTASLEQRRGDATEKKTKNGSSERDAQLHRNRDTVGRNNTKTEYEVSSYISFLDSLIDYPNDVKELRSSHVLHNLLGCDKEVTQLFNEMGRFLVPNPEAYEEVISQIEKHYHNKCLTWIAQVLNEHFSTPWTIVTFVAAFLALGMSFIQTYYTIYPRGG